MEKEKAREEAAREKARLVDHFTSSVMLAHISPRVIPWSIISVINDCALAILLHELSDDFNIGFSQPKSLRSITK